MISLERLRLLKASVKPFSSHEDPLKPFASPSQAPFKPPSGPLALCQGCWLEKGNQEGTHSLAAKHLFWLCEIHISCAEILHWSQSVKDWRLQTTFWKLRCRKSARCCGAKDISKSKCAKHVRSGVPFEVYMWKSSRRCSLSTFPSHHVESTSGSELVSKLTCCKSACRCGAKHAWESICWRHYMFESFFGRSDVAVCGKCKRDGAPCQKWASCDGFVACPKTIAGVGHLTRIWKDGFRMAGAVQETCSSEMLERQGADFLRGVALWSIRSSGLLKHFGWQVQHFLRPGITFS